MGSFPWLEQKTISLRPAQDEILLKPVLVSALYILGADDWWGALVAVVALGALEMTPAADNEGFTKLQLALRS